MPDINAVIEHTGAKNPLLWGHSIGGMFILTLLAKYAASLSQPVKGIILEHTTFTNPVKTMLVDKIMTAIQKPVLVPTGTRSYTVFFVPPWFRGSTTPLPFLKFTFKNYLISGSVPLI